MCMHTELNNKNGLYPGKCVLLTGTMQDRYWDEIIPKEIPYTVAAEKFKKEEFKGSAEETVEIKDCDKVKVQGLKEGTPKKTCI